MKVAETWVRAKERLGRGGIEEPSLEAEVLIRQALNIERPQFYAVLKDPMAGIESGALDSMLRRRLDGEPLAYITETREFYGLELHVNADVLVPRQETELLVDTILTFTKDSPDRRTVVADVGTGSGAVALAVGYHLPQAVVYATDVSQAALHVADVNRRRHRLYDRVTLLEGDLLEPVTTPVDIIVANLPYVTTDEMAALPADVGREPAKALDGGADGLDVMRRLFEQAPSHLRSGGWLVAEIAPQQLETVMAMGRDAFPSDDVAFERDLLGLSRAVVVRPY